MNAPDTTQVRQSQVRETAANADVILAGENALPVFSPSGVDSVALERIVYNTKVSIWPCGGERNRLEFDSSGVGSDLVRQALLAGAMLPAKRR